MRKLVFLVLIAALGLCGCAATEGFFGGAVKDFNAVVDTGKGMIGVDYDPTNGTSVQYMPPYKVYTPVPEK